MKIDLDKFLKGEIAYVVDTNNIDELLGILEVNSDLHWLSDVKPTKYNPFNSYFMDGEEYITLGIYKTAKGCYGLGYNEKWWFESNNYKVEVF